MTFLLSDYRQLQTFEDSNISSQRRVGENRVGSVSRMLREGVVEGAGEIQEVTRHNYLPVSVACSCSTQLLCFH